MSGIPNRFRHWSLVNANSASGHCGVPALPGGGRRDAGMTLTRSSWLSPCSWWSAAPDLSPGQRRRQRRLGQEQPERPGHRRTLGRGPRQRPGPTAQGRQPPGVRPTIKAAPVQNGTSYPTQTEGNVVVHHPGRVQLDDGGRECAEPLHAATAERRSWRSPSRVTWGAQLNQHQRHHQSSTTPPPGSPSTASTGCRCRGTPPSRTPPVPCRGWTNDQGTGPGPDHPGDHLPRTDDQRYRSWPPSIPISTAASSWS